MSAFELEVVGGPWGKRLAQRRCGFEDLAALDLTFGLDPVAADSARYVWTQSAFSEYASAASFAAIATSLLRAGAPIDLVAAAGDFVADEMIHAELSAHLARALGGAISLDVDRTKLVRPSGVEDPILDAAVLLVRTSCVGEALTVPLLNSARASAGLKLMREVIERILRDESAHARLGPYFLDWAASRLTDADRAFLGRVAGAAVRAYAPLFEGGCTAESEAGALDCATFDEAFTSALEDRVVRPLAARGIDVPADDVAAVLGAISG
jgi:hypothetical protein